MKKVEVTVYSFGELSENAKHRAALYHDFIDYQDEYQATADAFCREFNVTLKDWSIDSYSLYVSVQYNGEDSVAELSGVRLYKYLLNNHSELFTKTFKGYMLRDEMYSSKVLCYDTLPAEDCAFTGFCADVDILQPMIDFMKNPYFITLKELLQECLESWAKAYSAEIEYQETDEYLEDYFDANEYLFYEDGTLYQ